MDGSGAEDAIEMELSDTQRHLRVDRARIAEWITTVLRAEGHLRASISVAIVDGATMREINRAHLGHDWTTDVISFPLSEPGDPVLAGELVVSAEMAVATANEIGVDACDELALYIVHGLLHLCGHDDRTDAGAAEMRRREDERLSACGVRNPFALVAASRSAHEASPAGCSIAPQPQEPTPCSS